MNAQNSDLIEASEPSVHSARPGAIRLVVVESHPVTRSGLARLADCEGDILSVGETGLGTEALTLIEAVRPDVVSVGVTLDDMTGLQLARQLRDRRADLGIVILTERGDDDEVMFRALDTGASALVGKDASVAEIIEAIRHSAVSPLSFSANGLGAAMHRRTHAPQPVVLSKRESEVLLLLYAGKSVPQIAATLYVSLSTAKTYVARLYDKLEATSRTQALIAAVRRGLIDLAVGTAA
ncbi:MAG: hypothetical protein QOK10_1363 [Pseudonocardiales bacterium]|jgi:DNA-binding NarL/FixJ family response regulator|nr:hypothetical protein [Pseudonocardiales bacterium]